MSKHQFEIRETFLPFAKPDVGQREIDSVSATVASGWWTTGPRVKEFEKAFADYVGSKHAIAVNSATGAMHLALEAIGLEAGDEVITTTYTFAATAEVIRYFDAKPALVDVEPKTLNIDPNQIEECITRKTRAIIPVHVGGHAADMEAISYIADKHSLHVIEDAAHALPTEYKGQKIGSVSDFSAFSFYATKTLATGEGGMITTDNDEWAERCQIMCLHGISKDAWKRYTDEGSWYYEIVAPGFKYNMTDIAAALGLVQLDKLEQMNSRRQEIAEKYRAAFEDNRALQIPVCETYSTHPYHLYILRLNLDELEIDRNQFIEELRKLNIGTSVHWIPLHMHPYYVDTYGYHLEDFPEAFKQYQRVISLPIYSAMSDQDVEDVISAINYLTSVFQV